MPTPTYIRMRMWNLLETFPLEEHIRSNLNGLGSGDPRKLQRTEVVVGEIPAVYVFSCIAFQSHLIMSLTSLTSLTPHILVCGI
jgi:hypothetical protein